MQRYSNAVTLHAKQHIRNLTIIFMVTGHSGPSAHTSHDLTYRQLQAQRNANGQGCAALLYARFLCTSILRASGQLYCSARSESAQALVHPSAPECGFYHSYSFTFKNKTQFRHLRQDAVVRGIGQRNRFPFHYVCK